MRHHDYSSTRVGRLFFAVDAGGSRVGAIRWAVGSGQLALWLTTYEHLPWNVPFYRSEGFDLVPESECGPDVRHHLDERNLLIR